MHREVREDLGRTGIALIVGVLGFLLVMWVSSHLLMRLFTWQYPHDGQDGIGAFFGSVMAGLAGGGGCFAAIFQYLNKKAARKQRSGLAG
jgi:hypothetical protein